MGDSRRRPVGWLVPLAVIGAWQVLDDTGVVAFEFLPAPRAIGRALSAVVCSGELAGHLLHTAGITILAAVLALVSGGALGWASDCCHGCGSTSLPRSTCCAPSRRCR
jgi:ABC-type nitrate/sulfonate/bicarbonate transport system permease component